MKKQKKKHAKIISILLFTVLILSTQHSYGQVIDKVHSKEELIKLSKQKWQWMADRNIDSLNLLFDKEAVFVHMGGTMNKEQEISTIASGDIQYKHAEIEDISIRFIGNTAILLDKIRLTAIVGGNEVVNPFMVTEIYVKIKDKWKLGSLSFTRLLGD